MIKEEKNVECKYDISDKRTIKKLSNSKRFLKYPDMFLNNVCQVRVNKDDALCLDEFTIRSKNKILPRKIYLYGKKTNDIEEENCLYLNYWMQIFMKTLENGYLYKHDFEKSNSKLELTIGLPLRYRLKAFNNRTWSRNDVIQFLSCLFDSELKEETYEQQDLLECILIA